MLDLTPALTLSDGRPVVSSLNIAKHFQKEHRNVLREIGNLCVQLPAEFSRLNFELSEYLDSRGKRQPSYEIARDGFTLVVMGFTGPKALAWKLRYIEAFKAMEQELLRLSVAQEERESGQSKIGLPDSDSPGILPEAVLRLKPSLRATAMHSAVQAAKLTGGGEADIERLFLKYCEWLCPRAAKAIDERGQEATGWYAVFLAWLSECVVSSREAKTSSVKLYDHFCQYQHERYPEMMKPSQKNFGHEMRSRFLREKNNNIYYHAILPNAEGAVSLGRKWTWNDSETEQ